MCILGDALLIHDMFACSTVATCTMIVCNVHFPPLPPPPPPFPSPPSRTAPQEVHMRDGNMIVSVEQIIMKLDMASEENVRLRNTIHANNQLLDQKLKQFEPIIAENQSE